MATAELDADQVESYTGLKKAAILLVTLGEEASSKILKTFSEDEVHVLGREVARLQNVSTESSEKILEEFYQMSVAHDYVLKGGVEYARNMLINAFGPEQARSLLDRLMKTIGSDAANFDALQKADPQQLAKFIHSEHPQTIALILSHLKSSQAAALLSSLPAEMRPDVALRMAHLFRFSWKWRRRSPSKVMERTREETKKALHGRREGRHSQAAFTGEGGDLEAL